MTRSVIANNGDLIKQLTKEAGMTQQDLADELDYTLRAVQKWCSQGVNDYHVLVRIADIFDIAVEDLIYEK